MPTEELVRLEAANLQLVLGPQIGGSVQAFTLGSGDARWPILRNGVPDGPVLEASSFPLVPYVNRIRGGRFRFRDREVVLRPNMSGDPSPLHGQGWLNRWDVRQADTTSATLTYRHEAGEWPWAFEAEQAFALDERGLSVRLSCRNLDEEPMPCGLGQHPYFPCGPETRIATEVSHVWTTDEHVLPVEKVPVEGRYALNDRLVCGQSLDHGFGGWGGSASFSDPDWPYKLCMSSADARFFQLYSPAEGGIFVAEPVTHANAALNAPEDEWPELGMRVLEPGETMHLDMRLEVILKSRA